MADQSKTRSRRHNVVHCLKCNEPQECLSVHLRRVCMKNNTPEEIDTELENMKSSAQMWIRDSRTWDYKDLCEIVQDEPCRLAMLKALLKKGFLVDNQPHESDTDLSDATAPSSSTAAASTSEATPPSSSTTAALSSEPDSPSEQMQGQVIQHGKKTKTSRHKKRFLPSPVELINKAQDSH